MVNSSDVRNKYIDLYINLRRYIWEFDAAKAIAELEVACYERLPSLYDIHENLDKVKSFCREILRDDKDLEDSFSYFYELVDNGDGVFSKLPAVEEVTV